MRLQLTEFLLPENSGVKWSPSIKPVNVFLWDEVPQTVKKM
jgi:hypothetical protein